MDNKTLNKALKHIDDLTPEEFAQDCERLSNSLDSLVLLKLVHDHFESQYARPHEDGPGHYHGFKGRWDKDGSVCEWCQIWDRVRECLKQNGQ